MDSAFCPLDSGNWTLDNEFWALGSGPGLRALDSGFWILASRFWTPDSGLYPLDPGLRTLGAGYRTLDSRLWVLDPGRKTWEFPKANRQLGAENCAQLIITNWTMDIRVNMLPTHN